MLKKIKLGNVAEIIIEIISLGYGEQLALWIAKKLFNKNTCGCCERKQWLNRLTNPAYNGNCGSINLF
jgi:hypothetical protein